MPCFLKFGSKHMGILMWVAAAFHLISCNKNYFSYVHYLHGSATQLTTAFTLYRRERVFYAGKETNTDLMSVVDFFFFLSIWINV